MGSMSASAATATLVADDATSATGWTLSSGTSWPAALGTSDGNTAYGYCSSINTPLRVSFADPSSSGVINSVTINVSARASSGDMADVQLGMYLGTTSLWESGVTNVGTSYTTLSYSSTTRPGGGSWTWTDVQNLNGLVQATRFTGSGYSLRVTYAEIIVDYTAATPNTVTFATPAHPAAAYVTPSQANVVVDRFSLQRTAGTTPAGSIATVTIRNAGTTPYLTVAGVDIWRDVNTNGTLETGTDVKLNASSATFSGADAVVTINEPISDSAVGYLVAYNVTGTAMDGNTMSAAVQAATGTNVGTISGLPRTAGSVFTVDNANPAAVVGSPTAGQVVAGSAGSTFSMSGTVSDSTSGVTAAHVRIQRTSDGQYWTGSGWGAATWLSASLAAPNWTYGWTLPIDNGVDTYSVVARATDAVGRSGLSSATSFSVDSVGPAITGVTAIDNTHAEVTFDQDVDAASIQASDFVITGGTGLAVSGVSITDARTVVLTTASQVSGTAYTVTVPGDVSKFVTDAQANKNTPNTSAGFTGLAAPSVTAAPGPHRPTDATYVMPSAVGVVIDEIRLSAPSDAVTLTQLTVVGLDTGNQLQSDVAGVSLYADDGDGVFSAGTDTQLGTQLTFDSQSSGTAKAVFNGLSLDVPAGGSRDVWIVYDIHASATHGRGIGSRVQSGGVTVASPATVTSFATINSASSGQTVIVDGVEPVTTIVSPAEGEALTLAPGAIYSIHGTAGDGHSGVTNVEVRIAKNGVLYWDGLTWSLSETWLQATDTSGDGSWSTWDPDLPIPASDGTDTFSVTTKTSDLAGNVDFATSSFTIDNVKPYIQSAVAVDATHVDVVFSESLDAATVASGDFTIAGLTVSGTEMPDGRTVRLTTTSQVPDTVYTVSVGAGNVADLIGNTNDATSRAFAAFGSTGDATPPSIPGSPAAVAGLASPEIAAVSWTASTDNVAVTGYNVWRAVNPAGPFVKIGTATGTSFSDVDGVPGQSYFYRVSAYDAAGNESAQSAVTDSVAAIWSVEPHEVYTRDTDLCKLCHSMHEAATESKLFRPTGGDAGELSVCYACHDGSGASSNVENGATNSFAATLRSGHSVEAASTSPDLTNVCSDCHTPHADVQANPLLPSGLVNGVAVTGAGNGWCLACHDDSASWYGPGYGALITDPSRDATGYPIAGTFPGATTYQSAAANAHINIPASSTPTTRTAGDCLYCHVSHRASAPYDGLVATFTVSTAALTDTADGTFAALCFECHDGSLVGAQNIKQFVTGGAERSGHKIKTSGGLYPVGAPLPCYECHNPHGSTRSNTRLISDALGGSLDPSTDAGARAMCFTCHTTSDTAKGWDSEANSGAGAYTTAIAAGQTVAGLPRDAVPGANLLRLPDVVGHREADAQNCYQCHGASYEGGGYNVHAPSGGVSTGGTACYACHSAYEAPMDRTGADRTLSYHHVMGTASTAGDIAPNAGTYPTSPQDVYCVSCHSDHNYFNANQAANLRASALDASGATVAASDYIAGSSPYGVCVSCHQTSLTKEVTGLQKDDGSTATPKIVGGNGAGGYSLSAHNYEAASTFGDASTFSANCVKCHNDEQVKEFQTSTTSFGTHWSATRRILSALGGTQSDPMQEEFCYRCHSTVYNPNAATSEDYYGTGSMTTAGTTEVYEQFQLSGSTHPVAAGKVECESCHNAHVVSLVSKVTDPINTYSTMTYTNVDSQPTFCLRCHDADGGPGRVVNDTTYVPYDVTMAQASSDKATNAARGHWSTSGSISAGERVSCAICHDNHGSTAPKLLGSYDASTDSNKIVGTVKTVTVTANDNTVCDACHQNASASFSSGYTRNAAGYPTDRTWPGMSTYTNATNGIHRALTGGGEAAGSCNNCHDVHGTANTYDEVKGTFTEANFGACFSCHDGTVAGATNIKQFYPTTAGGSATQSGTLPTGTRFGHRVRSNVAGATLSQDEAVPCYDCHNPHGSAAVSGLQVVTMTNSTTTVVIGDAANEIVMSSAAGVRNFCFACHTTYDNNGYGYNGTAMAQVTSGATFEGIDRVNLAYKLRLPSASGHNLLDSQSCYQCHGTGYTAGSSNVHNPTGGVSNGGQDCYGCHSAYSAMDDQLGTHIGSTTTFHHVLGSTSTLEGDEADQFWINAYPRNDLAPTTVYCLSCHVDHDKFNANKGANLRASGNTTNPSAANTDWAASGGGVCLSCHSTAIATKDATGQKVGGATSVIAISSSVYDASAHQYPVSSSFGGSAFQADCVKCHDDEQTAEYQTSTFKFGTHWSAENRILAALGVTVPASTQTGEALCFTCHTGATAGNDGYNTASMTAVARSSQTLFANTYKHNVAGYTNQHKADETQASIIANKHVECEDCHDAHAAKTDRHVMGITTGNLVSGALTGVSGIQTTFSTSNWTAPTSYTPVTAAAKEYEICFKCHSGANTSVTSWGGTGAASWTDQGLEFSPQNQSYHPVVAALPATDPGTNGSSQLQSADMRGSFTSGGATYGGWANGDTMYCSDCHAQSNAGSLGPHGSAVKWMLKGPNQAWPYTTAAGNGGSTGTYRQYSTSDTNLDTANGLFCRNCHVLSGIEHTYEKHPVPCVNCHIRVPHGGKVSRLIRAGSNVPARYTADGIGGTAAGGMVSVFGKANNGSYVKSNCNQTGCSSHGSSVSNPETW